MDASETPEAIRKQRRHAVAIIGAAVTCWVLFITVLISTEAEAAPPRSTSLRVFRAGSGWLVSNEFDGGITFVPSSAGWDGNLGQ